MKTRSQYLSVADVQAGMVLATPANAVSGGAVSFSLPAGHALTDENLRQLQRHEVEFIFISTPDLRTDDQVAIDAATAARRIIGVFEGADFSDANMATLFDQVLAYRSA